MNDDQWKSAAMADAALVCKLTAALESIANNTCCEGCQEAAKVARMALTKS